MSQQTAWGRLKQQAKQLSALPGVYRFLDGKQDVIYVGKAKNLQKRVMSYFAKQQNIKNQAMLSHAVDIDVTLTQTETEALLLEHNLIKAHRPRYNVLLRDDKSYPYLYFSDEAYPMLGLFRGRKDAHKKAVFGPFPNAQAARASIDLLQKAFKLRTCESYFFNHRSKPCMNYQIERCSAPCVGYIDELTYQNDVKQCQKLLKGSVHELTEQLMQNMQQYAKQQQYEQAAIYRDRLQVIRQMQQKQDIEYGKDDCDVVVGILKAGIACIFYMQIRQGAIRHNARFFPNMPQGNTSVDTLITSFLLQYYQHYQESVSEIVVNILPRAYREIAQILSHKNKTQLVSPSIGAKKSWIKLAERNAVQGIEQQLQQKTEYRNALDDLAQQLQLSQTPLHIECFDVSHWGGKNTVASCVVFDHKGAKKKAYRYFRLDDNNPGDDYAAMRQVVYRRYARLLKENKPIPDCIFIDGGLQQLACATESLNRLSLDKQIDVIAIAKGVDRKVGWETCYRLGEAQPIIMRAQSTGFHLLQHIRNEAHRFALGAQKKQRHKTHFRSELLTITGVGPKRKKALLHYFGGLSAIESASQEELMRVPGVNAALADTIYQHFHSG